MKKILFFAALITLCACSRSDKGTSFNYHGLPLDMPIAELLDSLSARGFTVDSTASDSGSLWVLGHSAKPYRLLIAYQGNKLKALQENHLLSSNDSTRQMWQQLRDGFEKELGTWPNCPILKEDHKEANFETPGGFITVTLENTYQPDVHVRYIPKQNEE